MKKCFRVIFVIAFSLFVVLESLSACFAASVSNESSSTTKLYEACELLNKLNIGDYSKTELLTKEANVTRSEFVKMATRLVLLDDDMTRPLKEKSYFTDVTVEDENAGYINAAYDMGIIHGSELGKFYPGRNITLDEATKILISLLGYTSLAERAGGFPSGYRTEAYRLGLLDGVNMSGEYLLMPDAVIMMYNALETEYVEENLYDAKWNTVLEEFFSVESEYGLVENNKYVHLYGKTISQNDIIIDGKTFKTDEPNVDFIGMRVKYYYTYDSKTRYNKIICMFPEESNVLTLNTDDIEQYSQNVKEYKYYGSNNKEYTAKLDSDYTLIYNNRIAAISEYKSFVPTEGYVKLIDNDSDNRYEVVVVHDFINRVVKAVNVNSKWMTFFTDSDFSNLQLEKEEYYVYDANGNEKTLADISVGTPVSILKSEANGLNESLYVIYILSDIVEGTVSEISEDKIILEEGNELKLDNNADNLYGTEKIELGESGIFYPDMIGNVFYFETADLTSTDTLSVKNEPCLMICLNPDYEAAKTQLYAKVLRKSGVVEELKFSDSFKVSYPNPANKIVKSFVKYKSAEDALEGVFSVYNDDYHLIRDLALISVNANGEITAVELPSYANYIVNGNNGLTVDPDLKGDGLHSLFNDFKPVQNYGSGGAWYVSGTSYTMSDMIIKSSAPVYFSMPAEHDESKVEKEYTIVSEFDSETDYLMNFYAFDGKTETIDAGILKGSADEAPTYSFYAIDKVTMVYDEEYGDRHAIKAYKDASSFVTFYYDPSDEDCPVPSDIGEGDVVRVGLDADSNVKSMYRYVKYNEKSEKPEAGEYILYPAAAPISDKTGFGGTYTYRFGIAYKSPDGKKVYFCNENVVDDYDKYVDVCDVSAFTNVMVFNRKTLKWSIGSYEDVICYSDMPDEASYIAYKTLYGNQERVMYIY